MFIVGAQECSLLAHKAAHRRLKQVFIAGAQVCTVGADKCSWLARKSVPCWRISPFRRRRITVSVVGAQVLIFCARKCFLLPYKCVHGGRAQVFLLGVRASSLSARKCVPRWRISVFSVGAYESPENFCWTSVPRWRISESIVGTLAQMSFVALLARNRVRSAHTSAHCWCTKRVHRWRRRVVLTGAQTCLLKGAGYLVS